MNFVGTTRCNFFCSFFWARKIFKKTINFRRKITFSGKGMNLKGASWDLLVETMLIRKSLIHSIRIALCDNLESPGTRVILEQSRLLRGNFNVFNYFLDFCSSFIGPPGRDYAYSKELDSLFQNRLMQQSRISWSGSNSRKKEAS